MQRKGTGPSPAHSEGLDAEGIEHLIPGFDAPKSDEVEREIGPQPGMNNDDYWAAYYAVIDEIKRARGNKV